MISLERIIHGLCIGILDTDSRNIKQSSSKKFKLEIGECKWIDISIFKLFRMSAELHTYTSHDYGVYDVESEEISQPSLNCRC